MDVVFVKEEQLVKITLNDGEVYQGVVLGYGMEWVPTENKMIATIDLQQLEDDTISSDEYTQATFEISQIASFEILEEKWENPDMLYQEEEQNKKDGKKFYCANDSAFLCDEFVATFASCDGTVYENATIQGASVDIVAFYTNKGTNEPIYSYSEHDDGIASSFFSATVHPELGAVVVYDGLNTSFHKQQLLENLRKYNIAAKINGYTIDIKESDYVMVQIPVTEEVFRNIVTENYAKFNNPDNYYGQSTSYVSYEVKKDIPRVGYRIGYNKDGVAVIEQIGKDKRTITDFFSAARSLEAAERYKALLDQITPDEMHKTIYDKNRDVGITQALENLISHKNNE